MTPARALAIRRGCFRATFLSLALLASLPVLPASAGERVRAKGTTVRMEPPEGFVPADRFTGFQREDAQSSIQVNVVPGPRSEMVKAMTRAGLASRGMTLIASTTQTVNAKDALVLHVEQDGNGVAHEKWLVLAGDETAAVMLIGTTPKSADAKLRAAVRAARLGATWDAGSPTDRYEGLPFRLTPAGTLTDVRRMGGNVVLTQPGRPKTGAAGDPLYVAGMSHSAVAVGDLAEYSKSRAARTETLLAVGNLRGRETKVAGLDAYEIVADAKDTKSAAPLLLYQVLVPDGKGYWIMQGIVAAECSEEWLPVFRKITESIRKQEPDPATPTKAGEEPQPPTKPASGDGK